MNLVAPAPNCRLHPRKPTAPPPPEGRTGGPPWALLVGLAGSVIVRLAVAGAGGVRSVGAGLVFAALLFSLAVLAGMRGTLAPGPVRAQLTLGLAGAAVLCAVPLAVHLRTPGGALPVDELPLWAGVVTVVAVAEEVLLRGVLWNAAEQWRGPLPALVVTSAAFGLLHVPLYGGAALPLDLAVGLLFGGLRMTAGGWGAPAVAHTVADLAGWWLR
jgi:membrane protease YdiL (CAAX protease family)